MALGERTDQVKNRTQFLCAACADCAEAGGLAGIPPSFHIQRAAHAPIGGLRCGIGNDVHVCQAGTAAETAAHCASPTDSGRVLISLLNCDILFA